MQSLQLFVSLLAGDTMANKVLKQVFQEMHETIVTISPDSVMDMLFSKNIIGSDEFYRLRHVPVPRDRCRDLLLLLHSLPHPQTFIYLRLALLKDYPWIVDDIDEQLTSLFQMQQLCLDQSNDGKIML